MLALPVFLRAAFRHNYIFVNAAAGIAQPRDLEGKRVGTRYGMTANSGRARCCSTSTACGWRRSIGSTRRRGRFRHTRLPPGRCWNRLRKDVSLTDLLVEGKIDALVHPDVVAPRLFARGNVARLFRNAPEEERAYYRATKVVP